ncbi:MAG: DUF1670 domain-containing protein [Candidatus Aerophobetes bacterium]|nr:DUF1670 domain-containing protein [Candidatus Aerophobetes bacterium]
MSTTKEKPSYLAMGKRNFKQALIHLLETEYKIIGSHKVIRMIAEDVEDLARQFFPSSSSVSPGTLIWTTTSSSEKKVSYGRKTEDQATFIVKLPFLTPEDIQNKIKPHSRKEGVYQEVKRMVRIIKTSFKQGGLLSIAEIATIMNRGLDNTRKKLIQYQMEKGEVLPLKGIILDQGASPTHKGIIINLYEKKIAPPDIARQTGHSLEAVDRYISDYERVKILLRKGANVKEISQLIGRGLRTVKEYRQIATSYHPGIVTRKSEI